MRFAEIVIFKLRYCRLTKRSGLRYLEILGQFRSGFPFSSAVLIRISVRCCGVAVLAPPSSLPPPHPSTKNESATNRILIVKKKNPPVFSQLVALLPSCSIRQMLVIFSEGEFLNTVSKIQENKKEVAFLCSRPPKNVINKALSRRSRATMAKKCTEKRDGRAKSLYC